jgi:hypothetical protein
MITSRFARYAVGSGLAAAILAGCAGAGYPPQQASNGLLTSHFQPLGDRFDAEKCKSDHGVSVKPCSVQLDPDHKKAVVTTKGPKGGKFTYKDKQCTSWEIAEVEGSGNAYVVTAGTFQGKCFVTFTEKKGARNAIGTATLSVVNYTKRDHCPPTC